MPLNELHRKKRAKNLVTLAILAVIIAVLYGMTLVRFKL